MCLFMGYTEKIQVSQDKRERGPLLSASARKNHSDNDKGANPVARRFLKRIGL